MESTIARCLHSIFCMKSLVFSSITRSTKNLAIMSHTHTHTHTHWYTYTHRHGHTRVHTHARTHNHPDSLKHGCLDEYMIFNNCTIASVSTSVNLVLELQRLDNTDYKNQYLYTSTMVKCFQTVLVCLCSKNFTAKHKLISQPVFNLENFCVNKRHLFWILISSVD